MILSSGETVWVSCDDGFFAEHKNEALNAAAGRLTEIGGARVFAEVLGNGPELVICGAGHVSMPVITIAKMTGFHVTAIDDREQFVRNAVERGADRGLCMSFSEALSQIPGGSDTYFVIVTRGHMSDAECLLSIVKKPYAYIGMIGSRRKIGMVREALTEANVPQNVIDSVHMPIGLPIGAETPEEIAVSIMAEIIEFKSDKRRSCGIPADLIEALAAEGRGPAVLATIISKRGSSPRAAGTRMLVEKNGRITGTIGGGCAEATVINYAKEVLEGICGEGKINEAVSPVIMDVDMTGKDIAESGMICGGVIKVMIEVF
jgi:xanthine dehydrogenase accessory factor